jgi:hypothetical protein
MWVLSLYSFVQVITTATDVAGFPWLTIEELAFGKEFCGNNISHIMTG